MEFLSPELGENDASICKYSNCSKILNTFLFLFLNKMLVFMAEIYEMVVRIANREDPDQSASKQSGPEFIKLFSCSTQRSTKLQLLIKTKIRTKEVSWFKSLRYCIYHANKC